jgi:hypothetical protein
MGPIHLKKTGGYQAGCSRCEHLPVEEETGPKTSLVLLIPGGEVV